MSRKESVVALVTSETFPELTDDDRLLVEPLRARGIDPRPAVWIDESVDWASFDAVVVRSPWDWVDRPEDFQAWLAAIDRPDVRAFNDAPLLRTHLDKTYLRSLAARGATVIETTWVPRGETVDLGRWLADHNGRGVLKPALSGGARRTLRFDETTADDAARLLSSITSTGEAMLQPFFPEIEREGEISFVFFGGRFSHAIHKRPAGGDFRVQTEHGGSVERASPRAELIDQAARALAALDGEPLYARVDGVVRAGTLHLMELEVVEPELFFRIDPAAAARFADALAAALSAGASSRPRP